MPSVANLPRVVRFDYNKHLPQSSTEKTSDLFFILSALYVSGVEEKVLTRLTLEKVLFKSSQILAEKNYQFLNTFFFINTYGPHNNVFYKYLEELQRAGLIEVEKRDVFLTSKGLRVISDIIEELSGDGTLKDVLSVLTERTKAYANNPTLSLNETHHQHVIDTTDSNKEKTIEDLIKEADTVRLFEKSSQFKYIESASSTPTKVMVPPPVLNKLDTVLANVEDVDFEDRMDIQWIFA